MNDKEKRLLKNLVGEIPLTKSEEGFASSALVMDFLKSEQEKGVIDLSPITDKDLTLVLKKSEEGFDGSIVSKKDVVAEFKDRPLSGVGVLLLTLLGIKSLDELSSLEANESDLKAFKEKVQALKEPVKVEDYVSDDQVVTKSQKFIRAIKKKAKTPEIVMAKGEKHSCPDCGTVIFKNEEFSPCLCFGEDRNKKIFLAKSEKGAIVRFSKGWEPENIELLLEAIKRRKNPHEGE